MQRSKGAFDLVVRLVEVDVDDEDEVDEEIDDDFIDIKNFSGDEDLTVRRDPVAPLPLLPQESVTSQPSVHGFVASPGAQLTKYQLGRRLGEGSFGVVFAAHDTVLNREVAIKLLTAKHAFDPQILSRFLQEATAAARITHPGIVTMFDCGHIDGTAFIAMELLKGETLTSRLARSGRLTADTAMELVRQVASALDAAHQSGVIHRDLKPDNIFLVPDPAVASGERVKVLDFGLAKLRHATSGRTQAKMVFGTPCYMSPEQTRSAAKADHRSDIYALGCILFELICGRPPFDGDLVDVVSQHQRVQPARARSFVPSLNLKLDRLITQMLAKNPDERPQTMAAVQRALQEVGAIAPGAAETMLPKLLAQIEVVDQPQPKRIEVVDQQPKRRTHAVGTPPLAMPLVSPKAPIVALPRPGTLAKQSRIEHTLPWGKIDLEPEPEAVVTSAPVAKRREASQPSVRGSVTVLHGASNDPTQSVDRYDPDDFPEITFDVAPRRRLGLVAALVAMVVATALVTTATLVQRHNRTSAAAAQIAPST